MLECRYKSLSVKNMDIVNQNSKIIEFLNDALKSEFSAIQQYWVHGLTLKHWGFHKIGQKFIDESIEERDHVNKIARRILQLGGVPKFDDILKISTFKDVVEMLNLNLTFEQDAILQYRNTINELSILFDYTSADMLTQILIDEENHREWLQSQLRIIAEIGVAQYLVENMDDE
jgi:bacterioferritin